MEAKGEEDAFKAWEDEIKQVQVGDVHGGDNRGFIQFGPDHQVHVGLLEVDMLPLVDWIGFDVKAPWDAYDTITRTRNSGAQAQRSLTAILDSGTPFEARTTVHPALTSPSALCRIDDQLKAVGVNTWTQQAFRERGCTGAKSMTLSLGN